MGFEFRDIIFKKEEGDDPKPNKDVQKTFKSKFPAKEVTSEPATAVAAPVATPTAGPITPDNPACAPHLDKIMSLYEKGFDDLNMSGYDFYEYFKGVIKVGINKPDSYTMALMMAQTMDPSVTKASLLTQSEYYVTEINNVYNQYVANGKAKSEEAVKAKGQEEAALSAELKSIDDELTRLTKLKTTKEGELKNIDGKYSPEITDIQCKLMANDMAKESIVGTIQQVVKGINSNL